MAEVTVEQALVEAVRRHQAGQIGEAETIYGQILAVDPGNADAWHLWGMAAYQSGRVEVGLERVERALSIREAADYYGNLGVILSALKRYAQAVGACQKALELNPRHSQAGNCLGTALLDMGRVGEAIQIYRQVVGVRPDYAEVWNNLGTALAQVGQAEEAIGALRRAISLRGAYPEAHNNLGNMLKERGETEAAVAAYREALKYRPDYAEALSNMGSALTDQELFDQAIQACGAAIGLRPGFAEAYVNLGCAYRAKRQLELALGAFDRAVALKPELPEAHNNRGNTLHDCGRLDEAIESYRRALALRPVYRDAMCNLGRSLQERGMNEESAAVLRHLVSRWPEDAEAWNVLGVSLYACSDYDQMIECWRKAIALKPDLVEAHNNLGLALKDTGLLDEAMKCYGRALELEPGNRLANNNVLYTLLFLAESEPAEVFRRHLEWGRRQVVARRGHGNDPAADRVLRIGYVSPDFRRHSVAFFLLPILENRDRGAVHVTCYSTSAATDAVTPRVMAACDRWRSLVGMNDEEAARVIVGDQIDILIDLSGHTSKNRLTLFALRPAPVQGSYLGYPASTGLEAMDWRITDGIADPAGAEAIHCERLMRLPRTAWCFEPLSGSPEILANEREHVVFGSFNDLAKVNGRMMSLWGRILKAVPGSRILLKNRALISEGVRRRVMGELEAAGIPADRAELRAPKFVPEEHLVCYNDVDIGLDTWPYDGTTTTCEALWMGVPVVTMAGKAHVSRVSASLLTSVGLGDLVGKDEEEYVAIAVRLAGDLQRRRELRASLRERMKKSPLMDGARMARDVEGAYRAMWGVWVARVWFNRANGLRNEGKRLEAIELYRRAVELNAEYVEAYVNLGVCLAEVNRRDEAIEAYRRAVELKPDLAVVHSNLGNVLREKRDFENGIAACRRAIELQPEFSEAWNNLGSIFKDQERFAEAVEAYQRAIAIRGDYAEAMKNLGTVLRRLRRLDEAADWFQKALKLQPDFFDAICELAGILTDQARVSEAIGLYDRAVAIRPDDAGAASHRLLLMNLAPEWDGRAILREQKAWDARFAGTVAKARHGKDAERRLRIGYVSADFRDHVVGYNVLPLLKHHDREQFEIFCYSNVQRSDGVTEQFKAVAQWRNIRDITDDSAARMIEDDQVDILIDLSLHSADNRLLVFARKPAAVQVTFGGYPAGTGMSAMDYRLTDPHLDPPENDEFYVEKSVRLPHSFWCYDEEAMSLGMAPPVERLADGSTVFGCLNNFCKINDGVLELWKRVLDAVPGSILLLLAAPGSHRERLAEKLGGRVEFEDRRPRMEYLELYRRIDVALDSFPYNGHTTSLDALWMGVPVVTLVGKTAVARAGWSQLSNLGLRELAAHSPDEFVRIAAGLATDRPRLAELRSGLRRRMLASPLMDASGFTRGIEAALRKIWQNWCESA